jgi:GTP-binding protein YchF
MEFGILGLELSGKSTLFALLTGHDQPAVHGRRAAQVGVARVPDERLDRLSALFKPRKHTPATVRFIDVPGVVKGGAQALNLPELRAMDALAVVVRAFAAALVPHPEGTVDPVRDVELVETELLLADLGVVENRLERVRRDLGKRKTPELEAELPLLERCRERLEGGVPLRDLPLVPAEERLLKGFGLLTRKPLLIVLNVGEDDISALSAEGPAALGLEAWQGRAATHTVAVCATLEEEVSRLAAEDQESFLGELGLPDRALDRLLRSAYELLGLVSFFTVGEDECRAWSIPRGTAAVRAAGEIHSDIERGFIRAEVARWNDLLAAGSVAALRGQGTLRLEGKDYVIQDGDVINFRFAV